MKRIFLAIGVLAAFIAGGYIITTYQAGTITFKEETEYVFKDSTFKISSGWQLDKKTMALICPEGDFTIYYIQMPFDEDVEGLALKAWHSVDPHFNAKVLRKTMMPAKGGWEEDYMMRYDIPATESRLADAQVRAFQGIAYINLLTGSHAGFSRRGAQIKNALLSWRPNALKREDLSGKKAKKFTQAEAQKLTSFIDEGMKQLDVPGLAIQIVQDNKIVFSHGFGVTQKGSTTPVTPQTLFMIGSITKSLTSLMMAKLVDLEIMDWDMQVVKTLPGFTLADPDLTGKLLMKHTVSASTGMPRRDVEMIFAPADSGEAAIKQMVTMAPTTGFGETFQYSNHLVALGGFAAANVYKDSGSLLEKYYAAMQQLIFKPLGMHNTFFHAVGQKKPHTAFPHTRNFNGETVAMPLSQEDWQYAIAPAGSVWSTVEDMARYVLLELNNGKDAQGNSIISEKQLLLRRTPVIKMTDDKSYGLGIIISKEKGLNIVRHNGGTMGFASDLFFLPEHNIGVVILTNASGAGGDLAGAIRQRLLELLFDTKPSADAGIATAVDQRKEANAVLHARVSIDPVDTVWIAEYIGTYHNADLGDARITKTDKGFEIDINNQVHSMLGSKKEADDTLLLALVDVPFVGVPMQVQKEPGKKLILDAGQMKYEFVQTPMLFGP